MSKMKISLTKTFLAAALIALPAAAAQAQPAVGKPAPAFTGKTADGRTVELAALKGKTVVLEWTNKDCPYVRKHYGTKNMQALQTESKGDHDVVWLSVISSAPGTQGYLEPDEALANVAETEARPDGVILDPDGTIGKAYGAIVTPHMYVIDASGTLAFMGGIDDKPTSRWESVKTAKNYVRAALDDMAAGNPVAEAVTRPYGCSVKYGS